MDLVSSVFVCVLMCCFFFFKQKTAYEMRISDWSADVCSSDLGLQAVAGSTTAQFAEHRGGDAGAGDADRMAEGDTRAIDVELVEAAVLLAPAPRLEQRQHLGGEGLVELDQVEVVPAQARAGEKPL